MGKERMPKTNWCTLPGVRCPYYATPNSCGILERLRQLADNTRVQSLQTEKVRLRHLASQDAQAYYDLCVKTLYPDW